MSTIAVIIPALNEAGNIYTLVREVLATAPVDVIVVDNNSSDSTSREARRAGAEVVFEPRRGYGYACAAGLAAAKQVEVVLFLDGDHSFSPAELPVLLAPILGGKADLVLGSRELGHIAPGAMPFHQRFGNWLVSRLMNGIYGLSITDLGPYRAIRWQILMEFAMKEMTYGWPTEMVVKAARRGVRMVEVPVSYHARTIGAGKKIRWWDGVVALWILVKYRFRE